MFKKLFLTGLLFALTVVLFPSEASSFHHHHRGRPHVIIRGNIHPHVGIVIAPPPVHRHYPYYHRGHHFQGRHGYYGRPFAQRRRF